jgi:hypothetical protein
MRQLTCCSPVWQSGRRSKPGASGLRSEAGCAKPRLPSLESLPSFCTGCGLKAPNSTGHQRRLPINLRSRITEFPPTSGNQRPCRDAGVGAIAPGFAMLERAKRASHIDPPASSYAIMRRAGPYRGENPGPGKDVDGELDPTPGIREQPGSLFGLKTNISRGRRHYKIICAEITGKEDTTPLQLNMWRARDLLQDPGHPVEPRTEAITYGVTKCMCCCRRAGRARPTWSPRG